MILKYLNYNFLGIYSMAFAISVLLHRGSLTGWVSGGLLCSFIAVLDICVVLRVAMAIVLM